jgi:hypothetical protein
MISQATISTIVDNEKRQINILLPHRIVPHGSCPSISDPVLQLHLAGDISCMVIDNTI